ncbi:MAG TPA: Dabb family protein [Candidatus Dormibacteraeota bacterium]|nr:Dabb family protein [Candidatus Dormibacteraeota bacterium]
MYIHMFAFRWKPGVTQAQKTQAATTIKNFQGVIPGLQETFVGENDSPRGQGFTFGGVMKFVDKAASDAYGGHPAHQELLKWLMPLIDPIEIDFAA